VSLDSARDDITNTYIPMASAIKSLLNGVVVIAPVTHFRVGS